MAPGSEGDRRELSLTEAAAATGVSRLTIRRRLDAGRFPSARQIDPGHSGPRPWRIPVDDLRAAGLNLSLDQTGKPDGPPRRLQPPEPQPAADDLAQLDRDALRRVAEDRQRTIEILTLSLARADSRLEVLLTILGSPSDRETPAQRP
jgi:hypothetical protein